MISLPEQAATFIEYLLVFGGFGFIIWLLFSPGGRAFRHSPAALADWNISLSDFLLLAWLVFALGVLGQILVRAFASAPLRQRPEGETLDLIVSGSMFHIGAILAWLAVRVLRARFGRREPDAAAGENRRPKLSDGALTFLAAVPLVSVTGLFWQYALEVTGLPTARQELVDYFTQARSPQLIILMAVLALFVAPVSEELVFRAGVFRYLRTRIPRWLAFALSAGAFAALHANWISFLPLFVLGWTFAYAYERTGRIEVPMIAHALFNLNTLLLVLSQAAF